MNRVYHYRDRARLQLILRGKRVGLSLAEIREILDLYDDEGRRRGAEGHSSLRKFRERIVALRGPARRHRRTPSTNCATACERLEERLAETRPDLLPQAADYERCSAHGWTASHDSCDKPPLRRSTSAPPDLARNGTR